MMTTGLPTPSDLWGGNDARRGSGDLESRNPTMSSTNVHHSRRAVL